MQVRKYEAANTREALARIKRELGPDALILSSRQIGGRGILSRPRIELTVSAAAPNVADAAAVSSGRGDSSEGVNVSLSSAWKNLNGAQASNPKPGEVGLGRYRSSNASASTVAPSPDHGFRSEQSFSGMLASADVEPRLARRLAVAAQRRTITDEGNGLSEAQILTDLIASQLGSQPQRIAQSDRVVALVGPTGVGKTTTIAKLAADHALVKGRRVGLITTDTFRVGAVDQLRCYAKLIGIPLEVASGESEFRAALRKFRDKELILVDTAGRGPGDAAQIASMQQTLGGEVAVYLTVAATTRAIELRQILVRYSPLKPRAVVITKVDEAAALGVAVNASISGGLPLSYLTFGQRVPEDFAEADAGRVAGMLVRWASEEIRDDSEDWHWGASLGSALNYGEASACN